MAKKSNAPVPLLAERLLTLFLKKDLAEEVMGDLDEKYYSDLEKRSVFRSKLNYWWQVLNYIRPFAIRQSKSQHSNQLDMLQHNFLIFLRNIKKNKSTFVINLIGLTVGLTSALFIYLWISDETSYNGFHDKAGLIHQAMYHHEESGSLLTKAATQGVLAAALRNDVPEVELAVSDSDPYWFGENFSLSDENLNYKAKGKFSGKDYFKIFSFKLLHGQPELVLSDKKSLVVSESLAMKIFNRTNVVGETLDWSLLQFSQEAIISGVYEDIPHNSTEQFDFVLPFDNFRGLMDKAGMDWGNFNAYTYVQLKPETNLTVLNKGIRDFAKDKKSSANINLFFKPVTEKHLYNNYENGVLSGGKIIYVKMMAVIAFFILLIACINFMNLSTAKAAGRMKETGLKKTLGASRKNLIIQHFTESLAMTILTMSLALALVWVLLPQFNSLTDKSLTLSFTLPFILVIAGTVLLTGIIAGSYPAIYLTATKPLSALKGVIVGNNSSFAEIWARRGLVIFQFSISVILIVSVLIVYKQIEFVQTANLGYDKENVIIAPMEGKAIENKELFLSELKKLKGISSASLSNVNFLGANGFTVGVEWPEKDPETVVRFASGIIYYDMIETLGINLKEGRSFSKEFSQETQKIIFNETAIATMGIKDPVGKTIKLWGENMEIIGVTNDFHFLSLHEKVQPMFFKIDEEFLQHIFIKIEKGTEKETLATLEGFYKVFNPNFILRYKFMDLAYNNLYQSEKRIAILSRYFAGLAIMLSCLGLFGLATFTAEKKVKEIGIRKILGASEFGIVYMLSKDFTKMVLLSLVIGLPVSYLIAQNWLENFAYSIKIQWWYFLLAGVFALLISWLTVGIQTFRASRANPADCLRSE